IQKLGKPKQVTRIPSITTKTYLHLMWQPRVTHGSKPRIFWTANSPKTVWRRNVLKNTKISLCSLISQHISTVRNLSTPERALKQRLFVKKDLTPNEKWQMRCI